MLKRLGMVISIVVMGWVSAHAARAGEATLTGTLVFHSDTNKVEAMDFIFANPNDVAVDVSFVAMGRTSNDHEPGIDVDTYTANEAGVQTVSIPALGQLRLSTFELPGGEFEGLVSCLESETMFCFFLRVQASWSENVLDSSGHLTKTPLKVSQLVWHGHISEGEGGKLDDISYEGITQIQ